MKKLFLILLLTLALFSNAQEQKLDSITNTYQFLDKQIDKVGNAIKELAIQLQVPAEHVYQILVKQQVVKSITWLLVFILSFISLWNFFKVFRNFNRVIIEEDGCDDAHNDSDCRENKAFSIGVISIILTGLALIGMMVVAAHLSDIVTGFINPEYGALKEIFEIIK